MKFKIIKFLSYDYETKDYIEEDCSDEPIYTFEEALNILWDDCDKNIEKMQEKKLKLQSMEVGDSFEFFVEDDQDGIEYSNYTYKTLLRIE